MINATVGSPEPWRPALGAACPDGLLRGLWLHRSVLLAHWPAIALPTRAPLHTEESFTRALFERVRRGQCGPTIDGSAAGPGPEIHAASMLCVWERSPYFRGECHACDGTMLGVGFGGLLTVGSVTGRCVDCGARGTRFLAGFGFGFGLVAQALAATPWYFDCRPMAFNLGGDAPALRAVLQELPGDGRLPVEMLPCDPLRSC